MEVWEVRVRREERVGEREEVDCFREWRERSGGGGGREVMGGGE